MNTERNSIDYMEAYERRKSLRDLRASRRTRRAVNFCLVLALASFAFGLVAYLAPAASTSPSTMPTTRVAYMPPADWDVVPLEEFAGVKNIGVVSFHASGITHVDFSVNGAPAVTVTTPTLNPQTNVTEYWIPISANDFKPGAISLNAVAFAGNGTIRVLPTITLLARPPAVGSVSAANPTDLGSAVAKVGDGGTIYLQPGKYTIPGGGTNHGGERWITIDGGDPSKVTLSAAPGTGRIVPHINNLHLKNLTIDSGAGFLSGVERVWLDHCVVTAVDGRADNSAWLPAPAGDPGDPIRTASQTSNGNYQVYATDSTAVKTIYGFVNAAIVRNCDINHISGDALQRSSVVISANVHEFVGTMVHHPDVYQMWGDMDNVILYAIKTWNTAGAQGLFLQPQIPTQPNSSFRNFAIVDCDFEPNDIDGKGGPPVNQFQSSIFNGLIKNTNLSHQLLWFTPNGNFPWNGDQITFEGDSFHPSFPLTTPVKGVMFKNCVKASAAQTRPSWSGIAQ